jgi:cyclopropane fatty-acyl-phospholipid synthase-like methyltransferase
VVYHKGEVGRITIVISDAKAFDSAWSLQYAEVAKNIARMVPRKVGLLVEVGSGEGQFTVPFASLVQQYKIIALDRFKGPYSGNKAALLTAIAINRLKRRIKVVASDYDAWLAGQPDSGYDGVISSEFLPEITSKQMVLFFAQCHRVTKHGGFTVHSFLSPKPGNARQKRLIEADSNPRWTKTPPLEWFSPSIEVVVDYLRSAGFRRLRQIRLKSGLVIRSMAARQLLKDWDIRRSYWKLHSETLERYGLEIPDWIIVGGTKQS